MEEGQRWSLKVLIAWMDPGRNIISCTSQEIWVNLQSLFCLINPGKIFSKVIFIKIKYSKYSKLSSRLDWQMWFAALGSYGHNPWFISLLYRILESKTSYFSFFEQCLQMSLLSYQNVLSFWKLKDFIELCIKSDSLKICPSFYLINFNNIIVTTLRNENNLLYQF